MDDAQSAILYIADSRSRKVQFRLSPSRPHQRLMKVVIPGCGLKHATDFLRCLRNSANADAQDIARLLSIPVSAAEGLTSLAKTAGLLVILDAGINSLKNDIVAPIRHLKASDPLMRSISERRIKNLFAQSLEPVLGLIDAKFVAIVPGAIGEDVSHQVSREDVSLTNWSRELWHAELLELKKKFPEEHFRVVVNDISPAGHVDGYGLHYAKAGAQALAHLFSSQFAIDARGCSNDACDMCNIILRSSHSAAAFINFSEAKQQVLLEQQNALEESSAGAAAAGQGASSVTSLSLTACSQESASQENTAKSYAAVAANQANNSRAPAQDFFATTISSGSFQDFGSESYLPIEPRRVYQNGKIEHKNDYVRRLGHRKRPMPGDGKCMLWSALDVLYPSCCSYLPGTRENHDASCKRPQPADIADEIVAQLTHSPALLNLFLIAATPEDKEFWASDYAKGLPRDVRCVPSTSARADVKLQYATKMVAYFMEGHYRMPCVDFLLSCICTVFVAPLTVVKFTSDTLVSCWRMTPVANLPTFQLLKIKYKPKPYPFRKLMFSGEHFSTLDLVDPISGDPIHCQFRNAVVEQKQQAADKAAGKANITLPKTTNVSTSSSNAAVSKSATALLAQESEIQQTLDSIANVSSSVNSIAILFALALMSQCRVNDTSVANVASSTKTTAVPIVACARGSSQHGSQASLTTTPTPSKATRVQASVATALLAAKPVGSTLPTASTASLPTVVPSPSKASVVRASIATAAKSPVVGSTLPAASTADGNASSDRNAPSPPSFAFADLQLRHLPSTAGALNSGAGSGLTVARATSISSASTSSSSYSTNGPRAPAQVISKDGDASASHPVKIATVAVGSSASAAKPAGDLHPQNQLEMDFQGLEHGAYSFGTGSPAKTRTSAGVQDIAVQTAPEENDQLGPYKAGTVLSPTAASKIRELIAASDALSKEDQPAASGAPDSITGPIVPGSPSKIVPSASASSSASANENNSRSPHAENLSQVEDASDQGCLQRSAESGKRGRGSTGAESGSDDDDANYEPFWKTRKNGKELSAKEFKKLHKNPRRPTFRSKDWEEDDYLVWDKFRVSPCPHTDCFRLLSDIKADIDKRKAELANNRQEAKRQLQGIDAAHRKLGRITAAARQGCLLCVRFYACEYLAKRPDMTVDALKAIENPRHLFPMAKELGEVDYAVTNGLRVVSLDKEWKAAISTNETYQHGRVDFRGFVLRKETRLNVNEILEHKLIQRERMDFAYSMHFGPDWRENKKFAIFGKDDGPWIRSHVAYRFMRHLLRNVVHYDEFRFADPNRVLNEVEGSRQMIVQCLQGKFSESGYNWATYLLEEILGIERDDFLAAETEKT